jgi:hypothetical protein
LRQFRFWTVHYHGRRRRVDELELHLMRCRRRDEDAWVLVARVSGSARTSDLLARLRLTDSADERTTVNGKELVAVFDAAGLDRQALERRLRAGLPREDVRFGWSHFPDDGAALDVLLQTARAGLTRPARRVPVRSRGAVRPLEVESE